MGFVIIMSSLLGVALYVAFSLLKGAKREYLLIQKIKETPTTLIRYLEGGFFEFSGEISKESQTVVAPLSNEPCIWYRLIISEVKRSGKHKQYELILDHVEEGNCIIEDESMSCQISLLSEGIEMNMKVDNHEHTPTENHPEILKKFEISPNNEYGGERVFTFAETKLCVGDTLYAIGDLDVLEERDQLKVITANTNPENPEQKLYISDQSENHLHGELQRNVLFRTISGVLIFVVAGILSVIFLNLYLME